MQIPNYTIKQVIGEGGMATVYLADDEKFKSLVAVKVLKKEFVHNENIRKRFLAEARNMFKMSHPNIIKVTDLIDDGDLVAFVMEYMEGQTLKEYLDVNGKIPDDEIKKLFVQMLDAVGYVHEQGLVHRDIKPSNFMISAKGIVKLLDFGIAKNTDVNLSEYTITGTTQSMGTPMYMSPEQIKSTKEVTHQTDIYSLGVVLWQMATGQKPYDSNELSLPEIQVSILKEDLPPTKTKWDAIIKMAMQKSVHLRYQQCEQIKEHILQSQISTEKKFDDKTLIENIHTEGNLIFNTLPSSESLSNDIIIRMPLLSDTMTEGKIVKWNKQIGDFVKSEDILADVETDKATMEVVGYSEGILLYKGAEEGVSLKVNDILAIIRKKQKFQPFVSNDEEIIRMPLLSDTMTEGKIVKWNKQIGDFVRCDDNLADVETDKATMEVVGYSEGVLLYKGAEEGESLKVNDIVAIIKKVRLTNSFDLLNDAMINQQKNEYLEKFPKKEKLSVSQNILEKKHDFNASTGHEMVNIQPDSSTVTENFGYHIGRYWHFLVILIVIIIFILKTY